MKPQRLAIVIPAYKDVYFENALNSIANQTNKNFNVYIGDDASPHNLEHIVEKFQDRLNIVYKRFETNLGGKDLIAQWERCINITNQEEWIWLFSDDDIMHTDCVDSFYKAVNEHPTTDIFHFDVVIINQNNEKILSTPPFPQELSIGEFFSMKITNKLSSFVVEYIFKRELYTKQGGFENFDLAWCSDDATWIKFIKNKKLITITGPVIQWRFSDSNISSSSGDKTFILRKVNAKISYLHWINNFFLANNTKDTTSTFNKIRWVISDIKDTQLSFIYKIKTILYITKQIRAGGFASALAISYMCCYSLKLLISK